MSALVLIGSIFIDAAVLGILIRIVARYNATNDLLNRVIVIGGVTIGATIMAALWGEALGFWILIPQLLLTGGLLIWLVGADPVQAAIITVTFFAIKIGLRLAWVFVTSDVGT